MLPGRPALWFTVYYAMLIQTALSIWPIRRNLAQFLSSGLHEIVTVVWHDVVGNVVAHSHLLSHCCCAIDLFERLKFIFGAKNLG